MDPIKRDLDIKSIKDYLEERSPFSDGGDLRSSASGVVSDKTANIDEARNVGQKIIDRIADQHFADFTFKKKDQVVLMSNSSSVKVDEEEISNDPQLLFLRLISVANGYVQVNDLDSFFAYELCTYPRSIFESANLLRDLTKAGLLHAWWSTHLQLGTLLSSLIARRRVAPQTLRWFQLKN